MMAEVSPADFDDDGLPHRVALVLDSAQRRLGSLDEERCGPGKKATPDLDRENDQLLDFIEVMERLLAFMPTETSTVALAQIDRVADRVALEDLAETEFEAARNIRDIRRMLFSVSAFLRKLPGDNQYEMGNLREASDTRGCTASFVEMLGGVRSTR